LVFGEKRQMKLFKKPDRFPEKFIDFRPGAEIDLQVIQEHRTEEQRPAESEVERRRRLEPELSPTLS
jgi:hypothetical protein